MLENWKIIKSHDVVFNEQIFPGAPVKKNVHEDSIQYIDNDSVTDIVNHEHISQIHLLHGNDDSVCINNTNDDPPASVPLAKPGWDYKLTLNQAPKHVSAEIDESNILSSKRQAHRAIHSIDSSSKNASSWKEAMSLPDKQLWIGALKNKLNNLTSRGVIIETTLPKGNKPVGN
ncbi:hypothetical protein O181_097771 [Austropuccinia psidii MF-1]|uniref:Uncharacterized protein n=1 Tax=Austropuccinia psidii MF-1 TaxID=1389203 RepID=A0A9Q3J9L1_9BASI|nr:hypothetical protein [Austropuccinia psidii MF-1]